ncbi:MAG: hypothetical protein LBF65_03100 [Holosporales bacterium]|jgi:hypothetical protein|nr:hypothetical protein [Holosporales bacterium]
MLKLQPNTNIPKIKKQHHTKQIITTALITIITAQGTHCAESTSTKEETLQIPKQIYEEIQEQTRNSELSPYQVPKFITEYIEKLTKHQRTESQEDTNIHQKKLANILQISADKLNLTPIQDRITEPSQQAQVDGIQLTLELREMHKLNKVETNLETKAQRASQILQQINHSKTKVAQFFTKHIEKVLNTATAHPQELLILGADVFYIHNLKKELEDASSLQATEWSISNPTIAFLLYINEGNEADLPARKTRFEQEWNRFVTQVTREPESSDPQSLDDCTELTASVELEYYYRIQEMPEPEETKPIKPDNTAVTLQNILDTITELNISADSKVDKIYAYALLEQVQQNATPQRIKAIGAQVKQLLESESLPIKRVSPSLIIDILQQEYAQAAEESIDLEESIKQRLQTRIDKATSDLVLGFNPYDTAVSSGNNDMDTTGTAVDYVYRHGPGATAERAKNDGQAFRAITLASEAFFRQLQPIREYFHIQPDGGEAKKVREIHERAISQRDQAQSSLSEFTKALEALLAKTGVKNPTQVTQGPNILDQINKLTIQTGIPQKIKDELATEFGLSETAKKKVDNAFKTELINKYKQSLNGRTLAEQDLRSWRDKQTVAQDTLLDKFSKLPQDRKTPQELQVLIQQETARILQGPGFQDIECRVVSKTSPTNGVNPPYSSTLLQPSTQSSPKRLLKSEVVQAAGQVFIAHGEPPPPQLNNRVVPPAWLFSDPEYITVIEGPNGSETILMQAGGKAPDGLPILWVITTCPQSQLNGNSVQKLRELLGDQFPYSEQSVQKLVNITIPE